MDIEYFEVPFISASNFRYRSIDGFFYNSVIEFAHCKSPNFPKDLELENSFCDIELVYLQNKLGGNKISNHGGKLNAVYARPHFVFKKINLRNFNL